MAASRQALRGWPINNVSVFASVTSHRELVENLTMRDIKSRYKQSILGYAWAVANPLIYATIFTIIAKFLLKQNAELTHLPYTVFAYYGLLFWNLFSSGLTSAADSLVSNIGLITKVYFPREVFPIAAIMSKLSDFLFGLLGLLPMLVVFHTTASWRMIFIIPIIAVILVFTTGFGMLAACANLFYRDIRQVVALAVSVITYFVPNLYPLDVVPAQYRTIYLMNPMATLIEAARRITFPQSGRVSELFPELLWATASSIAILVIGFIAFKRQETRFAEFI